MEKYKTGDKLGSWNAVYLEKFDTVKGHNRGVFLCPICNKNTFIAEPSRVAHDSVHCCSDCKRNERRKRKVGDFVGKNNNIKIVKQLPQHRVLLKCPICGREDWNAEVGTLSVLTMCYDCYRKIRRQQFSKNRKYQKGDLVGPYNVELVEYNFLDNINRSYGWFKCKQCGQLFLARIDHMEDGSGSCYCSFCRDKSKGEQLIQSILEELCFNYYTQYIFYECRNNSTGYPLRFDFYLPDYNCCIEYDGEQHYYPIEYFGGQKIFETQQYRDNIKDLYCREQGIKLLRIKYDWSIDKIYESIIKIGCGLK